MAPIRWGICSAGQISHDFVVGVKALPESEHRVEAVAARSVEDAAKFAKTHSIPSHYGSYSQLAADKNVSRFWSECDGWINGRLRVDEMDLYQLLPPT